MSTATTIDPDWRLPSARKVGVLCLLIAEIALFTIFVVAYVFYIGKSLTGPYPSEVLQVPIFSSICLLSSSLTIMAAEYYLKRNRHFGFKLWWFITIVLALIFLGDTILEWYHLIYKEGLTIQSNVFGTTFYSLVGLHASHVVVGLVLLGSVFGISLRAPIQHAHHEHVEMISWYWHYVDLVWIVVFTVVYVIGR